jgi:hypothetical protein
VTLQDPCQHARLDERLRIAAFLRRWASGNDLVRGPQVVTTALDAAANAIATNNLDQRWPPEELELEKHQEGRP